MAISGKELIQRAIAASGGIQPPELTEAKELEDILSNAQSTHLLEAEESVFNSISSLYELYRQHLQDERESVLAEIKKYIEALEDPFKKREARKAYDRIKKISVDKEGRPSPYGRLSSQRGLKLTAQDILVLTWMGATDANAAIDAETSNPLTLTKKDIEDRKLTIINTAITTCHEYGPNSPACYGGTVHALTNSLNKIHKSVLVVMNKKLAFQLALSELKFDIKKFFDTQSPEEKEAVLKTWGSDEPDNDAALFLEKAKKDLSEKLSARYNNILSKQEISDLADAVDSLERTDLINPNLHDFIKSEAKTIFKKLSPDQKRKLLSDWDGSSNNRINFIIDVNRSLQEHSDFSDLFKKLNPDEIAKIEMTLSQLNKDELDPMGEFEAPVSDTPDEDKALLDHPDKGWFNPGENTLFVILRKYTPEKGYKNLLKTVLGMVSTSAVAKAVVEVNKDKENALTYLAYQKDYENFKILVTALCKTTEGEQAFLNAIKHKDPAGNFLLLAAKHQSSSNFEFLVNKIKSIEGGMEILLHAMGSGYLDRTNRENDNSYCMFNVLMIAAKYQNKKSFTTLITTLNSTDKGQQKLIDLARNSIAKPQSSNVFTVAAEYQIGDAFDFFITTMLELNIEGMSGLILSSVIRQNEMTISNILGNHSEDIFNIAAQHQPDKIFIKFIKYMTISDHGDNALRVSLKNTSNTNHVLNVAARYKKDGGFLDLIKIILKLNGGKDLLSLLLKKTDAIAHAMRYQNFDSLYSFLTLCKENEIKLHISVDTIRNIINNELLSREERATITDLANTLKAPSTFETLKKGILQNWGFMSSKTNEDRPVTIHAPIQPNTNVSPDDSFIETLKNHRKALEETLEKTEYTSPDHMLVLMTYSRVNAVTERNEQKGDVMQSLFQLAEDIQMARNNILNSAGQGFFSEQQGSQSLPEVIQNVISLIDDFKKSTLSQNIKKPD